MNINSLHRYLIPFLSYALCSSAFGDFSLSTIKANAPEMDWQRINAGEVVSHGLPDDEVNKAALAVIVAVKLPASIEDVLNQLREAMPGKNFPVDIRSQESIANSLQAFSVTADGNIDVSWFRKPKADGTFNVSKAELETLRQAALRVDNTAEQTTENLEPMSEAVRAILIGRIEEYRRGGLDNISPYDVEGNEIYPGDYLADSLHPLKMLQAEEPELYNAFLHYPNKAKEQYEQEFYVVTEMDEGRPVTSLKHWMVDQQENFTLIAERKFYISHSLDAMHTLILAVAEDEYTYLFMVNLSFTQKVAGMGSFIAHKIGRSKVKENIVPLFTSLQQKFPD